MANEPSCPDQELNRGSTATPSRTLRCTQSPFTEDNDPLGNGLSGALHSPEVR